MKKKNILKSPILYIALALVAVALFLTAGIGSTRAALTEFSEDYTSRVRMDDIGLTLLENGSSVAFRNYNSQQANGSWNQSGVGTLLGQLPANVVFEKKYDEVLSVQNTGTIDQYVRVEVYRYWVDEKGNKVNTLSPELIQLDCAEGASTGSWIRDTSSDTKERVILYYSQLLPAGATSEPFNNTISISNKLATKVSQTTSADGTTITTTYDYDGYQFCLEVTADAVQNHNAEDAVLSAWGVKVNAGDGSLSLK